MSTALQWVAKAATTARAVIVLVLVRTLAAPPYRAELLLTAAVTAAGAWAWSRIDGAAPRATTRH
ncbi:hypothetical protein PV721_29095 [Streptomyces sp. MB09-01]|uniref:hypothetical protein n=1 Tax=Streptomyces sp. MB09-01 TaxID=3028666 RepID=UPI0029B0E717|nr:hypothetical protein [Streptomyces sp. MB09-01]MDX3538331.1 hypothetical protein [Streptomyces sp. MB09-01]